jgi:hypothetical protein
LAYEVQQELITLNIINMTHKLYLL